MNRRWRFSRHSWFLGRRTARHRLSPCSIWSQPIHTFILPGQFSKIFIIFLLLTIAGSCLFFPFFLSFLLSLFSTPFAGDVENRKKRSGPCKALCKTSTILHLLDANVIPRNMDLIFCSFFHFFLTNSFFHTNWVSSSSSNYTIPLFSAHCIRKC